MATDVLCEVDSCTYWASGNKCDAASIYVVTSRNTDEASKVKKQIARHLRKKEDDDIIS